MLGKKAVGLVLHVGRQLGELRRVLACVVRAEEQLAHGKKHSDVGLRATAVAAVGYGQRFGRRHMDIQPSRRRILPLEGGWFAPRVHAGRWE
jgi:hypothetical protein